MENKNNELNEQFDKCLNKLGEMVNKLDTKLGVESEFGKQHGKKPEVSEITKETQTKQEQPKDVKKEEKIETETKKEVVNKDNNDNKENADKKEKQPKQPKAKKEVSVADTFEAIDLRVGKIEKIIEMEGSDNLYHTWVDVGEEQLREIGCGLRKYGVSKEEFTKDKIIVFANLKPKKLASIMSNGMILSASRLEKEFELIRPHADAKPGDSVYLDVEGSNPKKQMAEFLSANKFTKLMPLFKSNETKEACFNGAKMRTTSGVITTGSFENAPIS